MIRNSLISRLLSSARWFNRAKAAELSEIIFAAFHPQSEGEFTRDGEEANPMPRRFYCKLLEIGLSKDGMV